MRFPLSFHDPYYFGEKHVELLGAIHLLRGWQRLAFADRHVQVRVSDLPRGVLQMLDGFLERFASAAIVIGHLADVLNPNTGGTWSSSPRVSIAVAKKQSS
jgi:hypothetical protein